MKPPPFDHHAPDTVDEAVTILAELGEDGKVLAGGQSLIPLLNMRLAAPPALVDIGRLDELDTIEVTAGHVRLGARVRQSRALRDDEVAAALPLLRRTLSWVAHPVIRNRGTVVGSVVHADPAAELPALLALLGGEVELASARGTRTVAADDLLLGPLESDVAVDELAVAVRLPRLPAGTGGAITELARRHGDYALAGVAATVAVDDDRRVAAARSAFFGVAGTPVVVELADPLTGQPHDALDPAAAVATARDRLDPTDDIHATGAYRRHLAGVLLDRALRAAARDAAGGSAAEHAPREA